MDASIKILLGEDNDDHADMIQRMVASSNLTPIHISRYTSIKDVVGVASHHDVLLLDIGLNDTDDLNDLVSSGIFAKIPTIVITATDDRSLGATAISEGADDYLSKSELTSRTLERSIIYTLQRSKMQAQLAEERQEVLRMLENNSKFLSNFSHEIRTPLNAISGCVALLDYERLHDDDKILLDGIANGSQRLLAIVNDILDYSKISSGKLDLDIQKVDYRQLLGEILSLFTYCAYQKKLFFSNYIDPAVPEILWTDPIRIRQILINFVSNAFKFTDTGGIILRVLQVSEDTQRIEVEDTGRGIPPEKMKDLFTPFKQLAVQDQTSGTGLGLAISKNLARLLDGDCFVEANSYGGATFAVEIKGPAEKPFTPIPPSSPPSTIGVIGEDSYQFHHIEKILESAGLQVQWLKPVDISKVSFDTLTFLCINDYDSGVDPESLLRSLPESKQWLVKPFFLSSLKDSVGTIMQPLNSSRLLNKLFPERCPKLAKPQESFHKPTLQRVLVVDDDPSNRLLLSRRLSKLGIQVDTAKDGADAMQHILPQHNYDIIFLDIEMPQVNGIQLTQKIRDAEDKVTIIALTGHSDPQYIQQMLKAGIDECLVKPIDFDKLLELMSGFVDQRTA